MKGKNYRIIITELNMARDKIKYKDKYLKYAGFFFSPFNEESESQKLILMGSITKSMLALSLFLLPTPVDIGSLRRKKKTEN